MALNASGTGHTEAMASDSNVPEDDEIPCTGCNRHRFRHGRDESSHSRIATTSAPLFVPTFYTLTTIRLVTRRDCAEDFRLKRRHRRHRAHFLHVISCVVFRSEIVQRIHSMSDSRGISAKYLCFLFKPCVPVDAVLHRITLTRHEMDIQTKKALSGSALNHAKKLEISARAGVFRGSDGIWKRSDWLCRHRHKRCGCFRLRL